MSPLPPQQEDVTAADTERMSSCSVYRHGAGNLHRPTFASTSKLS